MKRKDVLFLMGLILLFLPFFLSSSLMTVFHHSNANHPLLLSFIKFAILATAGEVLGLRIRTGSYWHKGFGILPRAIVWGFLGITIKLAFVVFATGVPLFLEQAGLSGSVAVMEDGTSWLKVGVAFSISLILNVIYAPVLMTIHRITDVHIINNGGQLNALWKPINMVSAFKNLDWDVQWNFIFKKTIPLFWIPAQTITFLMPAEFRVLFAAILGLMLGVLLAVAGVMKKT